MKTSKIGSCLLSTTSTSDNKRFWKNIKPLFSDKTPINNKITLIEDNDISDDRKCAKLMNTFFSESILQYEIDRELHKNNVINTNEPVAMAIERYKNHPSIIKINDNVSTIVKFHFKPINVFAMQKAIKNMDSSKAFQIYNIPPKIMKQNDDICSGVFC